jgi:hypothetical protein
MTLHTINAGTELFNGSVADTTYRSVRIQVKSKVYQITISEGRYNSFFVRLENGNRSGGRYFATLNQVIDKYKSIEMKAALMQIK